jgi:hypothetical protein
VVDSYGKLYN